MIFHSNANKTHFHKKGCALGLILKVRVFGTRKWPIGLLTGQCFTYAHSHITWAGAAMDSCFALIGAHQHGIAVGSMNGPSQASAKHSFKRQLHTTLVGAVGWEPHGSSPTACPIIDPTAMPC